MLEFERAKLEVVVTTHTTLYSYWKLLADKILLAEYVCHQPWEKLCKILKVIEEDEGFVFQEHNVNGTETFIHELSPFKSYKLLLGVTTEDNGFFCLLQSDVIHMPLYDNGSSRLSNQKTRNEMSWQKGFAGYSVVRKEK
ncbi:hypothetical protein [Bacillus alkalicellulosilyticus]|uniref:hypothetical protein n=1 Tax=Alkalihalobacterium alkalicellulosilyticum TaxID=1912214 RepID=UPI000998C256|nr:hypothetical protein [Bacillus alkalicellulosilyticus]